MHYFSDTLKFQEARKGIQRRCQRRRASRRHSGSEMTGQPVEFVDNQRKEPSLSGEVEASRRRIEPENQVFKRA